MASDATVPYDGSPDPGKTTDEVGPPAEPTGPTENVVPRPVSAEIPHIPEYTLERKLAAGGFGEVWLAHNTVGVYYAVKILLHSVEECDLEFEGLKTYMRHTRDHSNLITIHHIGSANGRVYYVMDLADPYDTGRPSFSHDAYEPHTLTEDLKRRGYLGIEESAETILQLLHGLSYMHEAGLLHRDIKPANVVWVDKRPQLTDIGLVMQTNKPGPNALTPAYAPPEGVQDRSGDLYCLAKTFYEMVTGTNPRNMPTFPSTSDPSRLDAFRRLKPFLDKATRDEPHRRFQSSAEFQSSLLSTLKAAFGARARSFLPTSTTVQESVRNAMSSAGGTLGKRPGKTAAVLLLLFLVLACGGLTYLLFTKLMTTESTERTESTEPTVAKTLVRASNLVDKAFKVEKGDKKNAPDPTLALLYFANAASVASFANVDGDDKVIQKQSLVRTNRARVSTRRMSTLR